jgi:hypothetical protein
MGFCLAEVTQTPSLSRLRTSLLVDSTGWEACLTNQARCLSYKITRSMCE